MAKKIRAMIFALLALAITVFIFSNSLRSGPESHAQSGWVAAFLQPILNPGNWLCDSAYHYLIRKLAHCTEFGALGVCLGGVAANVSLPRKWRYGAVTAIVIACTDETIQAFTGRTNSIKDVALDSLGALCGLVFVWLVVSRTKKERL